MTQGNVYDDFLSKQQAVRKRLLNVLIHEPMGMEVLAKEIGILPLTLKRFYIKSVDVRDLTLLRILNYIVRKEAEYNIPVQDNI